MPFTLTAPPIVVQGAKSYAEHSGMTLEALVLRYLESVAEAEQRRRWSALEGALWGRFAEGGGGGG